MTGKEKEIAELKNAILHCEQFIAIAKEIIEKEPSTVSKPLIAAVKRQAMQTRYFLASDFLITS